MFFQLKYKVNRKTKYHYYVYAKLGRYVKGTHPKGYYFWIDTSDKQSFSGLTIEDCLRKWYNSHLVDKRRYWTPIYKNAISKTDRDNPRVAELWG